MKVLFHIRYFTITRVKKSLALPRTSLYTGSLYRAGLRSAVSWVGRGGGDRSANERVGDARRKVRIKPLKAINLGVAQA